MNTQPITNNNGNVLGDALQQQAAAIIGRPWPSRVKITRVTTDHWFNPRATATVYLSDGTSQMLVDCALMLVGTSTSRNAFEDYNCKCDDDLTALASADFTGNTLYCPALRCKEHFVLLGNLTVVRNCIGQTLQKGVKKTFAAKFGGNHAFLEFVYKKTSPLIMAVISEYYMVTAHETKGVSQSSHGFLRLVDKDSKVQPYAEDGEEPRVRQSTPSMSQTARKMLNVVNDMIDGQRSAAAPPKNAKKAKITKKRSSDDAAAAVDDDVEVEVLASGRGATQAANVRAIPHKLEATFARVASMFRMGNLMTTTLKCHLNDAQIAVFKARYETTPLLNDTFSFSAFSVDGAAPCLMDVKNSQVDFAHEWLGSYEPLLDDKAFREGIERSLGAVVQNTLRNADASVPEFLTTMTPHAEHQVAQWQQNSLLAQPNLLRDVHVAHVAAGDNRQAVRCLVASRAVKRGSTLLSTTISLPLTLPDLLALTIGHRLCGIEKALSLPNNITANFIGQDRSTPFFLLFGSMTGADNAINFVGDTATLDAANAQIVHAVGTVPTLAVLQLLCDVEAGTPIVIDRGDLFRSIYATISGKPMLAISGGVDDVRHVPAVAPVDWLASSVPSTPAAAPPTTTTTTTSGHTEEFYRQCALDALDPRLFEAYISSAPSTPKKRARDWEYEHSLSPHIINVVSPNCSPNIVKSAQALASLLDAFSDEAGFNDFVTV